MRRFGRILSAENGQVMVVPERSSDCGSCRACLGANGSCVALPADCSFPVDPGDRVEIQSTSGTGGVVLHILKLFLLPLVGFWAGFFLLYKALGEGLAALSGIAGFLLVFYLIKIVEKNRDSGGRCLYRVVRVVRE